MANNICIETTKYNSVCPLARRNRDFPTPLSPASVPLPPEPGGWAHSPARVRGWGESQFQRLEKVLGTLSTLWNCYTLFYLYSLGAGLVPAGGQAEDALQVRL